MAKLFSMFGAYRSENYYDCTDVLRDGFGAYGGAGVSSIRLFGHMNIGNVNLSNLQVPGQLVSDRSFIVQRWYARSNLPDRQPCRDLVKAWANAVNVVMVIGNRPAWRLSLYELLMRMPRTERGEETPHVASDPFPEFIPVRQNFSVQLDCYARNESEALWQELANTQNIDPDVNHDGPLPTRPRVWIHLEGLAISEDRSHDQRAQPADRVMQYIMAEGQKRMDEAELVVRWLTGMIETADPDARGQLHAVRDGVLEGRHRS